MKTLVAFGISASFYPLIERLDKVCEIAAFCDNDSSKWGQYLLGDQRLCISPENLKELENPFVLIMAERESAVQAIEAQCEGYGIPSQRVRRFLEAIELRPVNCQWPQHIQRRRVHKFIELLVHGTTECNFHCEYCYVWRKKEFTKGTITSEYTPEEIRTALSQKKLGGPCHINACALGETLLSADIVKLTYELLEEGHYLSLITNGTITPKIDEILEFPDPLQERMFFKLSFHYEELKRTNLLETFWKNVEKIKASLCSYSLEITPCDSLIDKIPEIKEEFLTHAGQAMPHITFTRDTNKKGLDLLSDLSLGEYKKVWSVFQSDLFELKCHWYKKKIDQFCYAGNWSYRINIVNGNLQSCYQQKITGTIFEEGQKFLPVLTVGNSCQLDYCFNNHAFLTWGDVPEISCSNYWKVRNRVASDGSHWIKAPYTAVMRQKLSDNNFEYRNSWPDYEKLFVIDRKPAFILFNSPDYGNLGDHAIALAERKWFQRIFPEVEFIEISCEQYIRENLLIKNAIQKEDILLLNGGGYLGSLWLWLEDLTKNIVEQYRDNKIILFPQSLYFENTNLGETEKKSISSVFNRHKDLTVLLRDRFSYELAMKLFDDHIHKMLIPDIVFSLKYDQKSERIGSLLCMRSDKESKKPDYESMKNVLMKCAPIPESFSTVTKGRLFLNEREKTLEEILKRISKSEVVVTDRLHAMIFCVMTDTPCVALDNISGKVSETCQWLENNPRIAFCEEESQLEEQVNKVLSEKAAKKEQSNITEKFRELEKYLKENCLI